MTDKSPNLLSSDGRDGRHVSPVVEGDGQGQHSQKGIRISAKWLILIILVPFLAGIAITSGEPDETRKNVRKNLKLENLANIFPNMWRGVTHVFSAATTTASFDQYIADLENVETESLNAHAQIRAVLDSISQYDYQHYLGPAYQDLGFVPSRCSDAAAVTKSVYLKAFERALYLQTSWGLSFDFSISEPNKLLSQPGKTITPEPIQKDTEFDRPAPSDP